MSVLCQWRSIYILAIFDPKQPEKQNFMKSTKSTLSTFKFFKGISLVLVSFFFLSLSYERPLFTITGICSQNNKPLEGVLVSILVDGGTLSKCTTGADGKYKLTLNFGKLVKLGFEKKGYLAQTVKLRANLNGVPESEMTHQYNFEMIQLPSDTSSIRFDRSVDEIIFDNSSNKFMSNTEYSDGVKADFDAVKKLIEEAKK
jgi:hypothetical protein